MRLEHLFDGAMWYRGEGAWIYGDHDAVGYGEGDGEATGPRIQGRLRWSNQPVRRPDGVWVPDVRGYIETPEGERILMAFRGHGVPERIPGGSRDVVGSVTFRSDGRYGWLDAVVAVLEARFDPERARMLFRVFACINELPASSQLAVDGAVPQAAGNGAGADA